MRTVLRSDDLTCPSCVARIERALTRVPGVRSARVHFTTGRIEVEHDALAPTAVLVETVRAVGYEAAVSRL